MHVLSTSYLIYEGAKQLPHLTYAGWTPLHFSFLSCRYWSKEMCAVSEINSLSKQWRHLAFGPCWHIHFIVTSLFFWSTSVQFRHLPPGPWLHFSFAFSYWAPYLFGCFACSPAPIQLRHFPPGGWLHFEVKRLFLHKIKNTALQKHQVHDFLFSWVVDFYY